MSNKKILVFAAVAAMISSQASAGQLEAEVADKIGEALKNQFSPDYVSVTVANGGRRGWIECVGAKISEIRIKEMKLEAEMNPSKIKSASSDEEIMASIENSKGEITLDERDINEYFKTSGSSNGFSNLKFDFSPKGLSATGRFQADLMLLELDLNLEAKGKPALRGDGVYIEDTVIYAEGIKQPDRVVQFIVERVNPIFSFAEIPFPVDFSGIKMTNSEVTMSGNPKKAGRGERWSWRR